MDAQNLASSWARLQEPGSPQERQLRRLLERARAGEVVRGAVLWLVGIEGK
jgi:hypothetical protein